MNPNHVNALQEIKFAQNTVDAMMMDANFNSLVVVVPLAIVALNNALVIMPRGNVIRKHAEIAIAVNLKCTFTIISMIFSSRRRTH